MAVKASGRFVPPSAFAAGTGKAFTGAYAWNAPREAVGRERPLIRQLENALARCASQVKMIKQCQDENDAQTRQPAQGAD
ncbi:TPA: hypothetical protein KKL03_004709 [Escherichia coli]|nr:hypothetical protein [Escherichia coli]HBD5459724.1 hypothetical protein [Escherichia coli]